MMGFLNGWLTTETKAANLAGARQAIGRAISGGFNSWTGGISSYSAGAAKWDIDRAVSEGYEKVIWVFRCVDAIAQHQASVPMQLMQYKGGATNSGRMVEDKRLNKLLNRHANPWEDAWAFRYRLSAQLLLSVKGAFIELIKSPAGEVIEMYLLPPDRVDIIPDEEKFIAGFRVSKEDGSYKDLKPENVMWIRVKPHPTNPYIQMTPLVAAGLAAETDYLARLFNRNYLKKDGRPGLLIGIKGDMDPENAEEIRSRFAGGYTTAGQTMIIESDGIDVVDMSNKPRDVQWAEAITGSKADILLAFGCPESILGNASGRCLRASENVHLANGQVKTAQELVGQSFELLQPTDDGIRVVTARAAYAKKEKVYKITTFSGRTLESNGKHPLYMAESSDKLRFNKRYQPVGWTSVVDIKAHFETYDANNTGVFTEVAVPLDFPQNGADTAEVEFNEDVLVEIPDDLFTGTREAQVAFLSYLYNNHGLMSQHTAFEVVVSTLAYARRLQRLLLRVGVAGNVTTNKHKHVVGIVGKVNMINFLDQIGLTGKQLSNAENVRQRLMSNRTRGSVAFPTEGLPPALFWDRVLTVEELGVDQTVAITVPEGQTYLGLFWEHNTYDNAESETETYWTGTVKPHCDAIARACDKLTDDDDDDTMIEYDYTTVDVLQRAERRKHDKIAQDQARGALTMNQYLEATGRDPVDSPGARVHFMPSGLVFGEDDMDVQAVGRLPVLGRYGNGGGGAGSAADSTSATNPFVQTGGSGTVGGANDQIQGELAATGDTGGQSIDQLAARALRAAGGAGLTVDTVNPSANTEITDRIDTLRNKSLETAYEVKQIETKAKPYASVATRMEGYLEGMLQTWSDRQLEVVAERVNHTKVRKGTRHWQGPDAGTKTLDTEYVVVSDEWAQAAAKAAKPGIFAELQKVAVASHYDVVRRGLSDEEFKAFITRSLPVIEDLVDAAAEMIGWAASNQSALVANHIKVLDDSGKEIKEIQATLTDDSFDRSTWRSSLAKMVTTSSIEAVRDMVYSEYDESMVKTWNSGSAERHRDSHWGLNGKTVSVGEEYKVGQSLLRFPGDPEASAEETTDCGCWLSYENGE